MINLDIVALTTDVMAKYEYTLDDVGLFRGNWGAKTYDEFYKKFLHISGKIIELILNFFGVKPKVVWNGELITSLDFWRNMILGRSGDAHSHLMEYLNHKQ